MGLFHKSKTIPEILAENHPTDWYEKKYDIFIKVFLNFNDEGVDAAINLFCLRYFESLSNIIELKSKGIEVDTVVLGKELAIFIKGEIEDYDVGQKVFLIGQNFKGKNPYIRFAKKLNHSFTGESAFIVSELILMGIVDVDNDKWLYDKNLFDSTSEDCQDRVLAFLIEKGLLNNEILEKIQETI